MKKLDGLEGENIILGFSTPVMGGKVLGAVGYIHAKTDELSKKLKADGGFIALGYQYPFSKTTRLYSANRSIGSKYNPGINRLNREDSTEHSDFHIISSKKKSRT